MKKLRDYLSDTPTPDQTSPTLTVDKTDPTDKLYNSWKQSGKVPGGKGLNNRDNGLMKIFSEKLKKEKRKSFTDYPNVKKAFENRRKIK